MAEPEPEGKSSFGFLTRKIGPVPIWLIALGIVGAYYWYTHYGPGAQTATAAAQQPQIIEVTGPAGAPGAPGAPGAAGPPGPAGPPAPTPKPKPKPRPKPKPKPRRRKPPLAGGPGPLGPGPPTVAQPVTVAAPMTAGDIYGDIPTASPDGSTYDSGYPSAAQLEGAYVPAG